MKKSRKWYVRCVYTRVHESDLAVWGTDCARCGYPPEVHR